MVSSEPEVPDSPACPLLGLAADRRTHFTYPHPGQRCFARNRPDTTDAGRQAMYCLSLDFRACDRYETWQRRAESGHPGGIKPTAGG
jgi:hypothetical protein